MENTFKNKLYKLLKKDSRLWDEEKKELNETLLKDLIDKLDEKLIKLLLSGKETKGKFFIKVKDVFVLKQNELKFFIDENKLDNSYTQYQAKIGLRIGNKLLSERDEVVLNWPFKDCVLEGGMTKEDQKRNEIFFNEVLAKDEIDRLEDPKALINWKRYTAKGEEKVKELKRDKDGTIRENLIIKGNNLLVLHSLKEQFAGKVKLIYIDPPYAKKADTFYNDNFKRSTFLTFMRNRLYAAKSLLADNGLLLVQIDINQLAYLQALMDEVFDSKLQSLISIKVKSPSGDSSKTEKYLEDVSEYILVYSKKDKISNLKPITIKELVDENSKTASQYHSLLISKGTVGKKVFEFSVGSGKNKNTIEVFELVGFEIKNIPKSSWSKEFYVSNYGKIGRTAKFSGEFLNQFKDKKGSYFFKYTPTRGKNAGLETETFVYNGEGLILLKDFSDIIELDDGSKAVAKIEASTNIISDISWQGIANEGGVTLGKGKKPEKLLKRIIEWGTVLHEIILDYHLGTGTTCAVAHKMGRQYIGVEQLDYGKDDSVIRLNNVLRGDTTGISKEVDWQGGGDFIYVELAKWNEEAKEKILRAKSLNELEKLFDELYERYFLNYNVKTKEFKEKMIKEEEFKKLGLDKQKKLFVEMLDMNQMYVNFSERADKKYNLSKEDIALSEEFYNAKK